MGPAKTARVAHRLPVNFKESTAPVIGLVTCLHPTYDLPSAQKIREDAISGLQVAGCSVVDSGSARDSKDISRILDRLKNGDIDLLIFLFCTWVAEDITLSIASEMGDVPLLLWALPCFELPIPVPSPLTGIISTGCNLRRMGKSFAHRIGPVNGSEIRSVARIARAASVISRLGKARFGIFGSSCPGMIDTGCDTSLLERHLGVTIVHFDLEQLLRSQQASPAREANELAQRIFKNTARQDIDMETVAEHCKLLLGMKSLAEKNHLDGFTVRCWPELRDQHKSTICLAMAELAESGIVSACEADLTALITSFILTSISGEPSCSLEITAYLEEQKALQLANCGSVALSLAANPNNAVIRGHMRTGAGAMLEFSLKTGPVTIAKLLRPSERGFRIFAARGQSIPSGAAIRGNVATVSTEPPPAQFIRSMLHNGVEHHLVLVSGDWTEELRYFAQFANGEYIPA
jgi:L-fucose isomerase-like protein